MGILLSNLLVKKMKQLFQILFLIVALQTSSCVFLAQRKIENTRKDADLYYYQKDYESALESYQQVINFYTQKGQDPEGVIYASAAKCLYYQGLKSRAMEYFHTALNKNYEDELSLYLMIQYYNETGSLGEEIQCLERYSSAFSDGMDIKYVRERLFTAYYERENYRKAYDAYEELPEESIDRIDILEKYYHVNEKLSKFDKANEIAQKIYNLDPNNLIGLNYVAYNAFSRTEADYEAAQKAYAQKKTKANYKILRQKISALNPRYKTAKNYYLRLYTLYKRPDDAAVLAIICTRLGETQNAAYYNRLSKPKKK